MSKVIKGNGSGRVLGTRTAQVIVCVVAAFLCFVPVFADLLTGRFPYAQVAGFSVYVGKQEGEMKPTPQITGDTVLTQTFNCYEYNIVDIELMSATYERTNTGTMHIELSVDDTGEEICSWDLDVSKLEDNHVFNVAVRDPQKFYVEDRKCRLTVTCPGAQEGNAVSLYYVDRDCYDGGELMINGEATGGDLYMLMTGTAGKTSYENTKVTLCFYLMLAVEAVLFFLFHRFGKKDVIDESGDE